VLFCDNTCGPVRRSLFTWFFNNQLIELQNGSSSRYAHFVRCHHLRFNGRFPAKAEFTRSLRFSSFVCYRRELFGISEVRRGRISFLSANQQCESTEERQARFISSRNSHFSVYVRISLKTFTDHFSGPGRAVRPLCVSGLRIITVELSNI